MRPRRVAVVFDERHHVHPWWDRDQTLLEPHQKVIDLTDLGLVVRDVTNGKSALLAVVAKKNPKAPASLLQRRHDWFLDQRQPNATSSVYQMLPNGPKMKQGNEKLSP